jgi:hypothetical protein
MRLRKLLCSSLGYGVVATILLTSSVPVWASALQFQTRRVAGVIVTSKDEVVKGVSIIATSAKGEKTTVSDDDGVFSLDVPNEDVTLRIEGQYIKPHELTLRSNTPSDRLRIQIAFLMAPIHQSIVITASALEPKVETHSDEIYKKTLFSRDDQLLETLNGGINAGSMKVAESRWRFAASDSTSTMAVQTAG